VPASAFDAGFVRFGGVHRAVLSPALPARYSEFVTNVVTNVRNRAPSWSGLSASDLGRCQSVVYDAEIEDAALSRLKHGFESRRERQLFQDLR